MSDGLQRLGRTIERNWYASAWRNVWLLPLWLIVAIVVRWRWLLAKNKRKQVDKKLPPVVVVGNINVGGTGKTPLIIWLVEQASALGLNPAVISRGYGGQSEHYPLWVDEGTPVSACGDEPRLIQSRLQCPVVVAPKRRQAVELLAQSAHQEGVGQIDIVFSDDGLQHYDLSRQAEIVVMDGERRFGNGWLLPIGPLREPVSRLQHVDDVVINGSDFNVAASALMNAKTGESRPLPWLDGQAVVAVSGIGNPERFHTTLKGLGAKVVTQDFPDHHKFTAEDFQAFKRDTVVMTEKDWVKCQGFATDNMWYLQVAAELSAETQQRMQSLLAKIADGLTNNIQDQSDG